MTTIALGVFMFTFVIVTLAGVIMFARSKLVATGDVTIIVNDDPDKALATAAGGTLLGTLSANKIFIPSACGGKGSCGVCKVKIQDGGGAMLPTEEGWITRGEARDGVRLSCQVKVKGDMRIELELGNHFHYQRKRILASQVGHVAAPRRADTTRADRMAEVLRLLGDPVCEEILSEAIAFSAMPDLMAQLYEHNLAAPCPLIRYP